MTILEEIIIKNLKEVEKQKMKESYLFYYYEKKSLNESSIGKLIFESSRNNNRNKPLSQDAIDNLRRSEDSKVERIINIFDKVKSFVGRNKKYAVTIPLTLGTLYYMYGHDYFYPKTIHGIPADAYNAAASESPDSNIRIAETDNGITPIVFQSAEEAQAWDAANNPKSNTTPKATSKYEELKKKSDTSDLTDREALILKMGDLEGF